MQSAYQILVADSADKLAGGEGNIWDSGRVSSTQSSGIIYAGAALKSRARYFWQVKIWDSQDQASPWSTPAFFEMGLLEPSDWSGDWVGFTGGWIGRVLYIKRIFHVEKEVRQARAYIAGLGYYVLTLNGAKVGDRVLDPAISEYSKRVYYSTYDITSLVKRENVMVVTLGPGWYGMPKLRMQVELTFADGSMETINSTNVREATTGPIVRSGIYDGELYDATRENPQIYSTSSHYELNKIWVFSQIVDPPGGVMDSQMCEPIKVVESFPPQTMTEPKPGVYVLDAGQNLAGWASLKVKGPKGTTVTMRFAESLADDGTIDQVNLRSAEAKDTYILKGSDQQEEWEPAFTYHGFRYIQVEGMPYRPQPADFSIKVVRTAVEKVGTFECSQPLLNRIHKMIVWTEGNNLHGMPTDCPQRDERMGWLNDLTVRIEGALYNFDLVRFYNKFIQDVADGQRADGAIADTAPFRYGSRPADPVCSSYLLLAWKTYEFYGDKEIIRRHYDGLKGWVNYLITRTKDGLVDYSYYGDWSPPTAFGHGPLNAASKSTPGNLMSTGFLFYDCQLIAQMAALLGKDADEKHYTRVAVDTAAAFNRAFWNEETGGYASNNQACNSFALYLGLVPRQNIPRVVENLAKNVADQGYHLSTGNLCTKYLLEALTMYGHAEVAYKVATQETYPSWGHMLAQGGTSLWERWEGEGSGAMHSLDHPMMGSVDAWFYRYCVGIVPDVQHPGFAAFTIRPVIFNELSHVDGQYASIRGMIKSSWRKANNAIHLDVTIPANSTATVFVPTKDPKGITEGGRPVEQVKEINALRTEDGYAAYKLGSGTYRFASPW